MAIIPDKQTKKQTKLFVESLSEEERLLIVLKKELYECRWDEMIDDLLARLDDRPYIYKLANRIEDDLERIEKLRDYEMRQSVNLDDYVKMNS